VSQLLTQSTALDQVLDGDGSGGVFYEGQIFTGADNHPVTFGAMMELAQQSGLFEGSVTFTGAGEPSGKEMDASKTYKRLGWAPKYASFEDFVIKHKGVDFYNPA
jgi:nucleoside-diphosphate-sugar epimerase